MDDVLIADDPLYEELYDVRREAKEIGNLVDGDVNVGLNALRNKGAVHKGFLRDLLGLPTVHRMPMVAGREGYSCFTFEACEAAFRNNTQFSTSVLSLPSSTEPRLGFLEMDEPQHMAHRRTVQQMFIKPRALTWWRERWINDIVQALVNQLKQHDRADLNLKFCARVPVHTISRAIGMNGDDALVFRHALLRSSAHRRLPPDELRAAAATVERMLLDLIGKRRAAPADDIVSHMAQADFELPDGTKRRPTDREIMLNVRLIMLAGGGTTWRQMGITLWALLTHPEQLEAVRADRGLLDNAVEESARWNPTDPVFDRLVMQDAELCGVPIPAGAVLEVCLGAANRDPARWTNPDAYDLHRPQQNHVGFGIGTHMCLGRDVARSEMVVGIGALLDAFPNLRLDPDAPAPYLTGGLEQRGISELNVLLR